MKKYLIISVFLAILIAPSFVSATALDDIKAKIDILFSKVRELQRLLTEMQTTIFIPSFSPTPTPASSPTPTPVSASGGIIDLDLNQYLYSESKFNEGTGYNKIIGLFGQGYWQNKNLRTTPTTYSLYTYDYLEVGKDKGLQVKFTVPEKQALEGALRSIKITAGGVCSDDGNVSVNTTDQVGRKCPYYPISVILKRGNSITEEDKNAFKSRIANYWQSNPYQEHCKATGDMIYYINGRDPKADLRIDSTAATCAGYLYRDPNFKFTPGVYYVWIYFPQQAADQSRTSLITQLKDRIAELKSELAGCPIKNCTEVQIKSIKEILDVDESALAEFEAGKKITQAGFNLGVTHEEKVISPIIDSFTATPSAIKSGSSSVLKWSARYASACWIFGPYATYGSYPVISAGAAGSGSVSPTATTEYKIKCQLPGTNIYSTNAATVNVAP